AVPDRFMQDDARPAGAEDDIHLAGRCIDGVEIDNRLARRLVNGRLPSRFLKIEAVARAPAGAVGARLAPSVLLDDNRDVEAYEGADIAGPLAARADNLDGLPRAGEGGGNLYN